MLATAGLTAGGSALLGSGCALPSPRPKDPPGIVTLEWYNYATPEFLAIYNEKLIPAFERRYPHIRVRMNTSLGDAGYDAKLLTLIAGRLAPDLFHVTQQNFPFYAAKDVLLPLDDLLRRDRDLSPDAFYPQVMDGMRGTDGRLLGLPADFSTIVMLYNRDLFDRAGVAYPQAGWTADDYREMAHRLTRSSGDAVDVWGTCNPNAYNRWPAWVWAFGGDLFTPDRKRSRMDDPAAIEGMRFYVGLSQQDRVAPRAADAMGQDFEDMFASQRAAIIPDSRYVYKRFLKKRKLRFAWDLAPMPRARTQATTFIWGGNCILKSTPHPEEAWTFLKFLSGPEGAALNREAGNALPAYRPAAEEEVRRSPIPNVPVHDRCFVDAVAYGRAAPFPPQYAEYNQAMSVLDDAFLGLKPVDQACREFAAAVDTLLTSEVF